MTKKHFVRNIVYTKNLELNTRALAVSDVVADDDKKGSSEV